MYIKDSVRKRIQKFIEKDTDDCILYPILNKNA